MKILLGSVLVCLLVSYARGQIGGVSFWRTTFTMTCPAAGDWYKGTTDLKVESVTELTQEYSGTTKGHYYCVYEDYIDDDYVKKSYHFYVRGKVCANCYELDSVVVAVGIVADIVLTLGVILGVYLLVRRRKGAKATPKKVSPTEPGSPPMSPDYERLNPNLRSNPYAAIHGKQ